MKENKEKGGSFRNAAQIPDFFYVDQFPKLSDGFTLLCSI